MTRLSRSIASRELHEALAWGDVQLRRHLAQLVELEYVLSYRKAAKNQREYQLLYEVQGSDGAKFLLGLIDCSPLQMAPSTSVEDPSIGIRWSFVEREKRFNWLCG